MDELRKPLFFAALGLALFVVLIESGSKFFTAGATPSRAQLQQQLGQLGGDVASEFNSSVPSDATLDRETPPGVAILAMALLDGLLLYSVGVMGASFVFTDRVVGRTQGVVSLIVALIALVLALVGIFATLAKAMLMIGLFTAAPFGTIAYMAGFGFFDRGGAAAVLGLLLLCKLGFAGCLVLAHPRFLQIKGLVLMILCSLLANLIIGFLHNLVPVFLVSITDAIGGIIVLILALIWAILMLIVAIVALVKLL